jgi:hypothetical protein
MNNFLKFSIAALLLGLTVPIHAQDSLKNTLSFQIGVAIPTGSFAKADAANEQQGFALPGFSANLELVAGSRAPLGWAFRVGLARNPLRDSAYVSALEESRGSKITSFSIEHGWRSTQLLTGPVFRIPSGRVEIDVKFLGGIACALAPKASFIEQRAGAPFGSQVLLTPSVINPSFSFVTGVSARIPSSTKTGVVLGVEYSSMVMKRDYELFANQRDVILGRVVANNIVISVGIAF